MKNYLLLITFVFIACGFSMASPETDMDKAMKSINGLYEAMTSFQYDKIGDFCTTDVSVIDDAIYYKSIDEFIALIKTYEGIQFKYKLDVLDSDFNRKNGLIIISFTIDFEMNGENIHINALENYVMKKERGKWLIAFIHSTPIKE